MLTVELNYHCGREHPATPHDRPSRDKVALTFGGLVAKASHVIIVIAARDRRLKILLDIDAVRNVFQQKTSQVANGRSEIHAAQPPG